MKSTNDAQLVHRTIHGVEVMLPSFVFDILGGKRKRAICQKYNITMTDYDYIRGLDEVKQMMNDIAVESLETGKKRLQTGVNDAIDTVMDIMKNGFKEETKLKAAFGLMDRGGLGSEKTVNVNRQNKLQDMDEDELFKQLLDDVPLSIEHTRYSVVEEDDEKDEQDTGKAGTDEEESVE